METRSGQPPEGRLIEEARERLNISQNQAAKRAGMSGTRWRQIVYGEASGGPGIKNPVHGNAETIARMATAVKISAEQLTEVGRDDAAEERIKLLREESGQPETAADPKPEDPQLRRLLELWPRIPGEGRQSLLYMVEAAAGAGAASAPTTSPTPRAGDQARDDEKDRRHTG